MKKMRFDGREPIKMVIIGFMLAICILLTYYFHFILRTEVIYTHFFYIPIIIASLWWRFYGILVSVYLGIMLLVLHILCSCDMNIVPDVLRSGTFVVVGTVVAVLNEKQQLLDNKLQIEKTLRNSEMKNQALINAMPVQIFQMSNDGTILHFLHGKDIHMHPPFDEFLGKKLYDILPAEAARLWVHYIELTLQTGETQKFEYQLPSEDIIQHFEGTVFPLIESQVILISHDITKQKQTENAQKMLEKKYQVLFETAKDAIYVTDETGRFIDVNQAACELLGYSKKELLKLSNKEIDADPRGYEAFLKVKDEELEEVAFEVNQQRKCGTLLPVEIVMCFFTSGSQRLSLAIARDITERKQAEESLIKAHQELKAKHIQLLQAGKMTAMGEMAAGVAHEVTQPLLGIKGFATALLEDMKSLLEKETITVSDIRAGLEYAENDLEIILQQTERMTTIVNNIRNFARESKTEMIHLDINQPIEDALMLFSEQTRLHNIILEKNLAPDLPKVMGNANQLQQVFINLITNARDAMDAKDGGGRLRISTKESTDGIHIEFEDSGIGADAETVSKMFEPFFTNKTQENGTGLGLSIVFNVINDHGGTINAESEPGRGCKFTICLPIAADKDDGKNGSPAHENSY